MAVQFKSRTLVGRTIREAGWANETNYVEVIRENETKIQWIQIIVVGEDRHQ